MLQVKTALGAPQALALLALLAVLPACVTTGTTPSAGGNVSDAAAPPGPAAGVTHQDPLEAAHPATPHGLQSHLLVSTAWLYDRRLDASVTVLHVASDRADYESGHIPGARFISWGDLVITREGIPNELPELDALVSVFEKAGIGDEGRLVLYGDKGGIAAARAFFTLDYLGHGERASLLDGGLETWRAEGRPISHETPAFEAQTFTPDPQPEKRVGFAEVEALVKEGTARGRLLDARPLDEYTGSEAGKDVARGGHIPGAGHLFWGDALQSKESPRLKAEPELHALFRRAEAAGDGQVIPYCRTGGQASYLYFLARYLGYDARLYDGSFIEWTQQTDTPVEGGVQR